MEEKIYKIEVFTKTIIQENGNKFKVYSTKINGESDSKNYMKIKFTKSVTNLPERHCFIYVKESKLNFDNRDEKYPCYWVSQIEKIDIIYPDYGKYFTQA